LGVVGVQMHFALTEQGFDDAAATLIFGGAEEAARGGELACFDRSAPGAGLFRILDDQVGELADGAGAHADQDLGGIIGEALEIAAQVAFGSGQRHAIVGQGAMVEADRAIACLRQRIMAHGGHREALGDIGQIAGVDPALARQKARHMGIAEQGDARWREADGGVERGGQVVHALAGQAVHQVKARGDACLVQSCHRAFDHVERLDAADARLDMRAEGLDAQIDAIDPHGGHRVDPVRVQATRVQLYRKLGMMGVEAAQ